MEEADNPCENVMGRCPHSPLLREFTQQADDRGPTEHITNTRPQRKVKQVMRATGIDPDNTSVAASIPLRPPRYQYAHGVVTRTNTLNILFFFSFSELSD